MKRVHEMTLRLLAGACAVLGAGSTADAVTLNPRGIGQVLIYPYYTANAGFGTLLSIVNTTPHGKALKVRFHEGYNGRVVGAFNLYLSPLDAWVGQVFDTGGSDGGAALATNDHSCVAPAFLVPVDPGSGLPRFNFDAAAYSGANQDGGPSTASRTREGYFDVIEMGEVTNASHGSLTAITHVDGVPANCAQIAAAWTAPGGYWTQDATLDLAPPTGGLYGAASIINITAGLMYTINATAIDGFSAVAQHSAPGAASPDLNSASANSLGLVAADVVSGSKLVELDFAHAEDAVSALLMADSLENEYVVDAGVGAQSDWIITFPTKRFYSDLTLLGASGARLPFDAVFSSANGGSSCTPIGAFPWNREEQSPSTGTVFFSGPGSGPPYYSLCYGVNALTLNNQASAFGSFLRPASVDVSALGFRSGHMRLDLVNDSTGARDVNHHLLAASGQTVLGLPAIGFLALDYVNGNVTPGVLANYSGAYPHRAHVTCYKTADPTASCD